MKRFVVALVAVLVATAAGTAFSFRPDSTTAATDGRYVALGDSVAAGLGLAGSADDVTCGRSSEAYGVLVAEAQNLSLEHLACSGAKADEGLYGPQEVDGTELTPQLDAAFAAGTPDLMSITIGANDLRWAQFVRQCYAWRCGSSWDDIRAEAYLLDLRWELYRTLSEIEAKSAGDPIRVVMTGYFDPLEGQTCEALPGVTAEESAWLSARVTDMNQLIADSVEYFDFAHYVPVDFSGHGLCSDDPWVQAAGEAAPVHPTAAGQQAYADAINEALELSIEAKELTSEES